MENRFIIKTDEKDNEKKFYDTKGKKYYDSEEVCELLNTLFKRDYNFQFEIHKLKSKNKGLYDELADLYAEIKPEEWG